MLARPLSDMCDYHLVDVRNVNGKPPRGRERDHVRRAIDEIQMRAEYSHAVVDYGHALWVCRLLDSIKRCGMMHDAFRQFNQRTMAYVRTCQNVAARRVAQRRRQ